MIDRPTRDDLNRLFKIDYSSGRFFWKSAPKTHPRLAGVEAGCSRKTNNGKIYWHIKINGRAYKRSHLMFVSINGKWPKDCVDHIDGNSLNDKPENIREATITENAWNHKGRKKTSSLPMGVRLIASGKYAARISHFGKQIWLGVFSDPSDAHSVYLSKRKELYGQFA